MLTSSSSTSAPSAMETNYLRQHQLQTSTVEVKSFPKSNQNNLPMKITTTDMSYREYYGYGEEETSCASKTLQGTTIPTDMNYQEYYGYGENTSCSTSNTMQGTSSLVELVRSRSQLPSFTTGGKKRCPPVEVESDTTNSNMGPPPSKRRRFQRRCSKTSSMLQASTFAAIFPASSIPTTGALKREHLVGAIESVASKASTPTNTSGCSMSTSKVNEKKTDVTVEASELVLQLLKRRHHQIEQRDRL